MFNHTEQYNCSRTDDDTYTVFDKPHHSKGDFNSGGNSRQTLPIDSKHKQNKQVGTIFCLLKSGDNAETSTSNFKEVNQQFRYVSRIPSHGQKLVQHLRTI